MPIVDGGSSYKYGAYLSDKSDSSTIAAFDSFWAVAESLLGRKVRRVHTDRAYDMSAWKGLFGAKCWAKILTVHGIQVTGGLKLDPRAIECRLLGYAGGHGNYKVQDVATNHVFVSHDIVFKEGQPNRTSPNVGEKTIPLFDVELGETSSEET